MGKIILKKNYHEEKNRNYKSYFVTVAISKGFALGPRVTFSVSNLV